MELSNFFKPAVNAILPAAPTGKSAGYRYINSTDQNLYELGTDGLWAVDTQYSPGAQCAVIGDLGDSPAIAHYVKAAGISEILSPFFPAGGSYHVHKCIIWQDRLVIARTTGTYMDYLCVFPNGVVTKIPVMGSEPICHMAVDSRGDLWIGTFPAGGNAGTGICRVVYDDDSHPTGEVFNVDGGQLPSKKIVGITAAGDDLWIFIYDTPNFYVVKFDGYEFTDFSAQLEVDTSIDVSDCTNLQFYKATQDDSGMLLFSLACDNFSSGKLIYFDAGVFVNKTIPATFANPVIQDFVKYGNHVLCNTVANSAPAAGRDGIWQWDDLTVLYDVSNGNSKIVANGAFPFAVGTAKIYKVALPASPIEQSAIEVDILAILTSHGAAAAYVDFAASGDDQVLINLSGTTDTIIKISSMLKWAI